MSRPRRLSIVLGSGDASWLRLAGAGLAAFGHDVLLASSAAGIRAAMSELPDALVIDAELREPGEVACCGRALLRELGSLEADLALVLVGGVVDPLAARWGEYVHVPRDVDAAELVSIVRCASERRVALLRAAATT